MDGIKIDVIGNVAKVIKKPSRITSGTVGLPIEYTFDEQWDGLTKVAVFKGGAIEKSVDLVADLVVPWEVLLVPGVWLSVGVYGANEDGSVAIPTIWANVLPISVGVDPEGDPSIDPTLPIWADVLQRIADVYIVLDRYDTTYAVRYIEQALSEVQKAQTRKNIGTAGAIDAGTGGEIFNDYENNQAFGPQSHAEGKNAASGVKGYNIISVDTENLQITVNDSGLGEKAVNKYAIGDMLQFDAVEHYYDRFKIVSLSANDLGQSVIGFEKLANGAFYFNLADDPNENYVWVIGKPYGDIFPMARANHAEGESTMALGRASHAEGYGTKAIGVYSHAEGYGGEANYCAHAEGMNTIARGWYSHAEGYTTKANGHYSHTEGYESTTAGENSHAEGFRTTASALGSHAEGGSTQATGQYAHSEGSGTTSSGNATHAEGMNSAASNWSSHAEGGQTTASGNYSHSEGYLTHATGQASHAEGQSTTASNSNSHAEGLGTTASGDSSHAEGKNTAASGPNSHAEGYLSEAKGWYSHAQNVDTTASSEGSHAEGGYTTASGEFSHAEGHQTMAEGLAAHAEGNKAKALNDTDHAEGERTTAKGGSSHAEGIGTVAEGSGSHAEGHGSTASGRFSHAEGYFANAKGENAHASGCMTIASENNQTAVGQYNAEDADAVFIVGNGSSKDARSNAFTVNKDGSAAVGRVGANGNSVVNVAYLNAVFADYPVEIGTEESTDYTGTWHWEKWDSGKAVCYGQFSFGTINCSNSWGNMKESTGMYKTFPSGLFLADTIPTYLEISIVKANAAAFVTQDKNDISAQKTGRFTLSRPATTTGDSVGDAHIGFYAIGRWK